MKNFKLNIILISLVTLSTSAFAELQNNTPLQFNLGAGATVGNNIYDNKTEVSPDLTANVSWNNFSIGTDGLAYDFSDMVGVNNLELSTNIAYQAKIDFPDEEKFDDLDRKGYVNAGVDAVYQVGDLFKVGMGVTKDISNRHDGWGTTLAMGKTIPVGKVVLQGQIGMEYESDKLSQHRYGVADDEVTPNRSAYEAKASISPVAQLATIYPISNRSAIMGTVGYKKLSNEIKDSPLVDSNHLYQVGINYLYNF